MACGSSAPGRGKTMNELCERCERCGRPEKAGTRVFPRIDKKQVMVHLEERGGNNGIECDTGRKVEYRYSPEEGESVWNFVPS